MQNTTKNCNTIQNTEYNKTQNSTEAEQKKNYNLEKKTPSKMKITPEMETIPKRKITATAQLSPNRKSYQQSQPGIEFDKIYAVLHMKRCAEKTTFLDKDN